MLYGIKAGLAGAALIVSASAQAEVVETSDNGFITRDAVVVDANLTQTWLALTNPAKWWSSEHTWSADAANLRLMPQAGGCFCEKIPAIDEPDRFTLEGSVEHMRVIQAYPENALRMVGALGPLQSEPVNGVLTVALTEVETAEGTGTRIVWEYNVGGSMRYEIPVISKAVDGVMSLQLAGLAKLLGEAKMTDDDTALDGSDDGEAETIKADAGARLKTDGAGLGEGKVDGVDQGPPAAIEAEDTLMEGKVPTGKPATTGPTVDEAFDDFGDFGVDDIIDPPTDKPDPKPPLGDG